MEGAARATVIGVTGGVGTGKTAFLRRLAASSDDARIVVSPAASRAHLAMVAATMAEAPPGAVTADGVDEALRWAVLYDFLETYRDAVVPHLDREACIVTEGWAPCVLAFAAALPEVAERIAEVLGPVPAAGLLVHLGPGAPGGGEGHEGMVARRMAEARRALDRAHEAALRASGAPVMRLEGGPGAPCEPVLAWMDEALGRAPG